MLKLTVKGKTDYAVIISRDASLSQKRAAAELQKYVSLISGAKLSIKTDEEPETAHEIVLGECRDASADGLGKEGFIIRADGDRLFITGSKVRGTLYGVYTFLEKYAGCRFYAEGVEKVPANASMAYEITEDREVPVIEYRDTFWTPYFGDDISVKSKSNGRPPRVLPEEFGGGVGYAGSFVHTLGELTETGNVVTETPCLTSEENFNKALANCRKWLDANPGESIISVSQNDVGCGCSCPACKAIDEREGSAMGSLLVFVNRIADELKKDYPDVWVDTLSYRYTRAVPLTEKARDNVVIRLCSIESCFSHPLNECTSEFATAPGKGFADVLKKWKSSCKHLHIWDYTTNFSHYLAPFPNFAVLRQNVKFFVENNVTGVFEQGNYQSKNAELGELRAYLLAKLLWNPDMSEKEYYSHMDDFCNGYYGKGGKYIRQYIDLIQNEVKDVHFNIYTSPLDIFKVKYTENADYAAESPAVSDETDWLAFACGKKSPDFTFLNKAKELFASAYEASEGEAKARIERSSVQIHYYEVLFLNEIYGENLIENIKAVVPENKLAEALKYASAQRVEDIRKHNKELFNLLKKYDITMINEGKKVPENPTLENLPYNW